MEPGIIVLFVVFVIAMIALAIYSHYKRRQMWQELAKKYGLRYDSGDPLGLLERYEFALFQNGHSQDVSNTLDGTVDGMDVAFFDFTYKTGSGKNQSTHHYSAMLTDLPIPRGQAPPGATLHIRPEHFFHRIASALGFDDINFEYERFNRAFRVTGSDKKFAYDICHPDMMEFLLAHPEHCWEIQAGKLLLYSDSMGTFDADEVERCLTDARGFLERLPSYLLQK